jgi:hypothetical protein
MAPPTLVPIPLSCNVGYGMEYTGDIEFEKRAQLLAMKCKKEEDEPDDKDKALFEGTDVAPPKKDQEVQTDKVKVKIEECEFCGCAPCLLSVVYDKMMFIAEGMEDELENKEICYELYRFVAKKLWGPLGKGFCKRIPHCIMSEIHDAILPRKVPPT